MVALALGLAGCRPRCCPDAYPPNETDTSSAFGVVFGYVVDQQHEAMPGLPVTLCGSAGGKRQTITDAQGGYRFEGVPPGKYELCAELANLARTDAHVVVPDGAVVTYELRLRLPKTEGVQ